MIVENVKKILLTVHTPASYDVFNECMVLYSRHSAIDSPRWPMDVVWQETQIFSDILNVFPGIGTHETL